MNNEGKVEGVQFCRKCGGRLLEGGSFCGKCGAQMPSNQEEHQEEAAAVGPYNNQDIAGTALSSSTVELQNATVGNPSETIKENIATDFEDVPSYPVEMEYIPSPEKAKKKWKCIFFSVLGVVVLATVVLAGIHFWPEPIVPQNINSINGCPEFYDVKFDMNVGTVSSLIKVKHKTITGFESVFGNQDSMIYLEDETKYELYGIPVENVCCGFDILKMETVIITFSKEDASFEEVVELYKKIYGDPTTEKNGFITWEGAKTTIDVYDPAALDDDDDNIVVRYVISPNSRFTMLSFDGEEIDPCGFLDKHYIFDKQPGYFINGLEEDDDYKVKKYSAGEATSFSQYTLYPKFEYMGIEKGYTAIEFNVEDKENNISLVCYRFLLDKDHAADRIDYIKNALVKAYGQYEGCTYTSTKYSDLGIANLSFADFKTKIANGTQGIYAIQWNNNGSRVTLNLTIDPELTYFQGSVAFSK